MRPFPRAEQPVDIVSPGWTHRSDNEAVTAHLGAGCDMKHRNHEYCRYQLLGAESIGCEGLVKPCAATGEIERVDQSIQISLVKCLTKPYISLLTPAVLTLLDFSVKLTSNQPSICLHASSLDRANLFNQYANHYGNRARLPGKTSHQTTNRRNKHILTQMNANSSSSPSSSSDSQ